RGVGRGVERNDLRPRTSEPRPLLGDRLSRAAVGLTRRRAAGTADGRAYRRRAADPCRLHGGGNSAAAEGKRYLSFGRKRELSEHGSMNGAEWLARALAGGGRAPGFFSGWGVWRGL